MFHHTSRSSLHYLVMHSYYSTSVHDSGCCCFSDINISQESVATHLRFSDPFIIFYYTFTETCHVCRLNNFENRSTFDKVKGKNILTLFRTRCIYRFLK